jgi:hypothetical protein
MAAAVRSTTGAATKLRNAFPTSRSADGSGNAATQPELPDHPAPAAADTAADCSANEIQAFEAQRDPVAGIGAAPRAGRPLEDGFRSTKMAY